MTKEKAFRIMWVDDDVDEIKYLLFPLENNGCRIEKVSRIPEAFEILRSQNQIFDLIVLDLLMPTADRFGKTPTWLVPHPDGANGIQLLIQIRDTLQLQIPVLILSVVPDAIAEMNIGDKYDPIEFVHKKAGTVQDTIDRIFELLQDKQGD